MMHQSEKIWFRIISDVHGHRGDYLALAQEAETSIQLGDLDFEYDWLSELDPAKHRLVGGNHDNYSLMHHELSDPADFINSKRHTIVYRNGKNVVAEFIKMPPHFLGNYGLWEIPGTGKSIFFVRGASSVDRDRRIPDVNWWAQEQLSYSEMEAAIKLYKTVKPDFVITHDCPFSVYSHLTFNNYSRISMSLTASGLQTMLEAHSPKLWVFGHHHQELNRQIGDTEFHCINILKTLDFDKSLNIMYTEPVENTT
jgi:predicted phosphohydrolase